MEQVTGAAVFEDEPAGARTQGCEDVVVPLERGEHDHAHRGQFGVGGDAAQDLETIPAWHPDVEQHDVRSLAADEAEAALAVVGLAHERDVVLDREPGFRAHPDQALVVHDDEADHGSFAGTAAGNVSASWVIRYAA